MTNSGTQLEDRVAIVTGASRGLGRALTVALADAGARVTAVARSEADLADTAKVADPTGQRVLPVVADLNDPSAGEAILAATIDHFGAVDILVNNAGVHYPTPFLDTSAEDWNAILDLNLVSVVNLTRTVGRELVRRGSGKVINVTSSWATRAMPQHTAYVTAKAALAQFTRALAREWARHGVTVNALAPGYFATEITRASMSEPKVLDRMLANIPQRRIGEPDEIGPLAVFLASRAADYVTGATFTIDGGMELT
ncbi:SDR family NAD(P)-dependent oxidoreductase [Prauserella cavernicola]|uniref:Glucose 1-dehydrogenase n=1 Tax=Prauserella cavernicola TaxID=2800127 RepID=A0A934V9K6_9PSEU|nr:glucose 1-dehydrogenase [Prauserella cavernicola]MBK1789445.1 glucose 1-dehydrogenase [Prauserella cavernicola]